MAPEDMKKTVIVTDDDIFYYTHMPFGLKNAGAKSTNFNIIFGIQINRNMEVYVDDLILKSRKIIDQTYGKYLTGSEGWEYI